MADDEKDEMMRQELLVELCTGIGDAILEGLPEGIGCILTLTDPNTAGATAYSSNIARSDIPEVLLRLAGFIEEANEQAGMN
jgi:hypothetical protein